MTAFLVLGVLTWKTLLFFVLQMAVITAALRGAIAYQKRLLGGTWRQGTGRVLLAHAGALLVFAAMTSFVDTGTPPRGDFDSVMHSVAVLWPLQVVLLAADLAIRALRKRRKRS